MRHNGISLILVAMGLVLGTIAVIPELTRMVGGIENLIIPTAIWALITLTSAIFSLFSGPTYQSKGKSPWRGIRRKNK